MAFDHRGHGRNGLRRDERFSLEACADDADAVLAALRLDRVIPVGYSMGGLVAQLLWHRHPHRVEGMVLCSTATHFIDTPLDRLRFGLFEPVIIASKAARERRARATFQRILQARVGGRDYHPWVVEELTTGDPRHLLEAGAAIGRFDSRPWIGSIDVPVSVLITEPDTVVHSFRQRELAGLIPHARTFVSAGDHDIVVTRSELFIPQLLAAVAHVVGSRCER